MAADREAGLIIFSLYRVSFIFVQTLALLIIYIQSSDSMEAVNQVHNVVSGLVKGTVGFWFLRIPPVDSAASSQQIELEETSLDAAKSSIVYTVTKNVATAGRAVGYPTSMYPICSNAYRRSTRLPTKRSKA